MDNVILHPNHHQLRSVLESKEVILAKEDILAKQQLINDMFMAQGYLTLNEALERLHNDCGDCNDCDDCDCDGNIYDDY